MKFVISSSALLSALQATGKVVSSKNTLPILDYFLLELAGGRLKVTASDLETTLVNTIDVDKVEAEGAICAPVKLMLDSLREFSEQPLTIEADSSTWEIKVSWKSGSMSIPGTSGMSYPALPELGSEKNTLSFDVETLMTGIAKTSFATADDELRPVMNGVYINVEAGKTTYVGTDAHKLVRFTAEGGDAAASFILPKKPVHLLKTVLAKEEETVKVELDAKNVVFNLKHGTLICRQIEGNYPNYNAVIPTANPNKVIADRVELLNAIKRVAVCSNQATNLIRFDISGNTVSLTAQDLDFSVSARESVPCSYDGEPITIGFKSTFLVDILSNLETPSIIIELADSTRAGVFKPVYDDVQPFDMLMLLMPMMING
jgi:DNA polymerase-3 subunit beta